MGVKGRRVALVEALSGTIISFQKVDAKCRERILTISGSSLVAIGDAKRLIQETIRRNVSPARVSRTFSKKKFMNVRGCGFVRKSFKNAFS